MTSKHNETRGMIIMCFWQLLAKKPFTKIKVSDLVSHADINRSTFYDYFLDKYDLLDQAILDLLKPMTVQAKLAIEKVVTEQENFDDLIETYLITITAQLHASRQKLTLLFDDSTRAVVQKQIKTLFDDIWKTSNQHLISPLPQGYLQSAIAAMMTDILMSWLLEKNPVSPATFQQQFLPISKMMLNSFTDL